MTVIYHGISTLEKEGFFDGQKPAASEFPSSLTSKYYLGPMLLNFSDQTKKFMPLSHNLYLDMILDICGAARSDF
jgi:hypothetical protein